MILKIFCDGASRGNPGPAAAAFVVYDQGDHLLYQSSQYLGKQTNNFAEYTAVLLAHSWLLHDQSFHPGQVDFFLDSELVVKQLTGLYKIKNPPLLLIARKIFALSSSHSFPVTYRHVIRKNNSQADALANHAIDQAVV